MRLNPFRRRPVHQKHLDYFTGPMFRVNFSTMHLPSTKGQKRSVIKLVLMLMKDDRVAEIMKYTEEHDRADMYDMVHDIRDDARNKLHSCVDHNGDNVVDPDDFDEFMLEFAARILIVATSATAAGNYERREFQRLIIICRRYCSLSTHKDQDRSNRTEFRSNPCKLRIA